MLHGIELPLHQNLIYGLSPTAALEQSLRAIWDAASWAAVLILPQIKLNSQLPSCTSFSADRSNTMWGMGNTARKGMEREKARWGPPKSLKYLRSPESLTCLSPSPWLLSPPELTSPALAHPFLASTKLSVDLGQPWTLPLILSGRLLLVFETSASRAGLQKSLLGPPPLHSSPHELFLLRTCVWKSES